MHDYPAIAVSDLVSVEDILIIYFRKYSFPFCHRQSSSLLLPIMRGPSWLLTAVNTASTRPLLQEQRRLSSHRTIAKQQPREPLQQTYHDDAWDMILCILMGRHLPFRNIHLTWTNALTDGGKELVYHMPDIFWYPADSNDEFSMTNKLDR